MVLALCTYIGVGPVRSNHIFCYQFLFISNFSQYKRSNLSNKAKKHSFDCLSPLVLCDSVAAWMSECMCADSLSVVRQLFTGFRTGERYGCIEGEEDPSARTAVPTKAAQKSPFVKNEKISIANLT